MVTVDEVPGPAPYGALHGQHAADIPGQTGEGGIQVKGFNTRPTFNTDQLAR